mgnify:CR=1 FL=1
MPGDRNFVRSLRNVTEVAVAGRHMVTEDSPAEVGLAITKWFREALSSSGMRDDAAGAFA